MYTTKTTILILFLTLCVQAHNDDDEDTPAIAEAIIHGLLGAATEMCRENETCRYYLHVIMIFATILVVVDIFITGHIPFPPPRRTATNAGSFLAGAAVVKSLRKDK